MKITDLKQQVKRPDRISVYVDGKYAFSLAADQLSELGLKVGQIIDTVQVNNYLNDSNFGKLRDQTYRWLAIRLRSEWEVQAYLDRKTKDEGQKQRLLKLLNEQGYINDRKFAEAWIRHRNLIKPMSNYRLKQELLQKRLPLEVVNEALANQPQDDVVAIKNIVAKRGHRYPDRQKLMAYLARQGFRYDDIKTALTEL